ncbi:hypothetical protein BCE_4096 [Bacillus cereus ATCC 10987]|uniref:Uncharacterized protein n=1 Tax=Bacillus cereus (strain ATCC 10987 / NRS 248) TaxID=222523 RepID=Q731R9_BACC1|nr:hypothetical protein BCE_4096 [Bacillus cereus ATCC 10987]
MIVVSTSNLLQKRFFTMLYKDMKVGTSISIIVFGHESGYFF